MPKQKKEPTPAEVMELCHLMSYQGRVNVLRSLASKVEDETKQLAGQVFEAKEVLKAISNGGEQK